MAHARNQIRDAVLAAVTGLATTKKNAFATRVHPITDEELPCVLVYIDDETSMPVTMNRPRRMECQVTVKIEGYVKLASDYDARREKIATEVTKAIYNNTSLQSLVKDIFLSSTERKASGESEKPVAWISMSFSATYHVLESDPETILS